MSVVAASATLVKVFVEVLESYKLQKHRTSIIIKREDESTVSIDVDPSK